MKFATRIQFLSTPVLSAEDALDNNNNAVRSRSNLSGYLFLSEGALFEATSNMFFVDAIFKYQGFSFQGEYANRDAEAAVATETDDTPTGDVVNVRKSTNL